MQTFHSLFRKSIFMFVFAWICSFMAFAQEIPIKIKDSGELLSTYNLRNEAEAMDRLKEQVSADLLEDILSHSQENSWPSGISTLEGRNKNRPILNEYTAYKVASFGSDEQYLILRIPASKNGYQPSDMRLQRDIYFIIGKRGTEEINGEPYYPSPQIAENEPHTDKEAENEMQEVRIIDPMELYSTYNLRNDADAKEILVNSGELSEDDFEVLADLANEKSWPMGINSYSNREKYRAKIKDYKAYMALDYESNGKKLMMVYIPSDENDFMPDEMQPDDERGFYMIFNRNGVEYVDENDAPVPIKVPAKQNQNDGFIPSVSLSSAYTFEDQLNVLVEGLHNNFKDLKGDEVKEDFLLGQKNESLLNLTGAEKTYIYEGFLSADVEGASMIADFGDYKSLDEGLKAYKALAQKVQNTKFPCCTLVQNQQENETIRTNYWLPFDINGKMHPSMAKMVMEVQLMKTLGIDKESFKTYDNYSLTLRVYKQK